MDKNAKLTREQVFFFCFLGVIANIVYTHTWIDIDAGRAAWLAAFIGIIAVIPFAVWMMYLGKFNPEGTIFDSLRAGLGRFPCWVICTIFIIINIAIVSAQITMFTEMLKTFFLQYTPTYMIVLVLMVIGFLIVNSGIIVMGRLIEILAVIGLLNYFASYIFAFPKMIHIEYIIPVFDTSIVGVMKGILFMTGASSELLLLLMVIVCYIPDPFKHYKWVVYGTGLGAVIFSFAILVIMGMMSPELAQRIAFGGVNAARLIQIGTYIQGLEIFVMGTYQFIAIGKLIICLYCTWISAKKIFGEKKPRLQLSLISFVLLITTVWVGSYNKAYFMAVFMGRYVILPFSLLVLVLASISVKKMKKRMGSVTK